MQALPPRLQPSVWPIQQSAAEVFEHMVVTQQIGDTGVSQRRNGGLACLGLVAHHRDGQAKPLDRLLDDRPNLFGPFAVDPAGMQHPVSPPVIANELAAPPLMCRRVDVQRVAP